MKSKKGMDVSATTVKDGMIMLHPTRWKILTMLKRKGKAMYIDEIADIIKEDRRLVSFHLATLEENAFLESEFKIVENPKSKGKAGRYYKLTNKFDKLRPELIKIIKS